MMFKKAFSLMELSIVLVIIGLLVGTVSVSQDLIQKAKLRTVIREISNIKVAVLLFKQKYGYLPGDFPHATDFWTSCVDAGSNHCNGDGDGRISTSQYEDLRMMQHLSLSGFIQGNLTGLEVVPGSIKFGVNTNLPGSSYSSTTGYWGSSTDEAGIFQFVGLNLVFLNFDRSGNLGPSLKPQDVYYMDLKFDDGLPASGDIYAISPSFTGTTCTTNTVPYSYILTDPTISCGLIYWIEGYKIIPY